MKGLKDPKVRPWDALGEREGENAPGLIRCLLNLLKVLVLRPVCFEPVLKPSSAVIGLLQFTCASEQNSALLPGVLSTDSESYQVTLPSVLLWEGS